LKKTLLLPNALPRPAPWRKRLAAGRSAPATARYFCHNLSCTSF
jgi:hypothetical protein